METVATYDTGGMLPITLDAFKNRACSMPFKKAGYTPPTPQEVDRLIALAGWSQCYAASLIGIACNPKKGSSTIRKWRTAVSHSTYKQIPYAAWRLMLLYAGVVSVDDGLPDGLDNVEERSSGLPTEQKF